MSVKLTEHFQIYALVSRYSVKKNKIEETILSEGFHDFEFHVFMEASGQEVVNG